MTPLFDEKRGIYRDCKWCGGKGCLACPGEADKEYKRQFPDGPKPILTITAAQLGNKPFMETIKGLIGPAAIMAAKEAGAKRAAQKVDSNPMILQIAGCTREQAVAALALGETGSVIEENIINAGLKPKPKRKRKSP